MLDIDMTCMDHLFMASSESHVLSLTLIYRDPLSKRLIVKLSQKMLWKTEESDDAEHSPRMKWAFLMISRKFRAYNSVSRPDPQALWVPQG